MKTFRGILDLQVESVLGALKGQQERHCREIESAVGRKAQQLLTDSRRRMRQRVHTAVVEERQRRETALLDARHRIETSDRRKVQEQYRRFLHAAAPLLAAELGERWHDAGSRRSWCEMVIGEAADRLAADPWTIEHPRDWRGEDTAWLESAMQRRNLPRPVLHENGAITAGLRVRLDSACLDATIEGLMADAREVEGQLLAAWERQSPKRPEKTNG
jgi:hypothetical protein